MNLKWPVSIPNGQTEPDISQPFGPGLLDYSRLNIIGHDGVDFPKPLGTPVYAAHDGYIVYVNATRPDTGLGIMEYFEEEGVGYLLMYWHFHDVLFQDDFSKNLSNTSVPVKQGDLIGHVDTTGFSTGNHLHLGLYLYKNKQLLNYDNGYHGAVDPLPYLRKESNVKLTVAPDGVTLFIEGDKGRLGIADPASKGLIDQITSETPVPANMDLPQVSILEQGFNIHK